MTEAALKLAPEGIRVAVIATDPARRARLVELVRKLHHELGTPDDADIVLTDDPRQNALQLSGMAGGANERATAKLPREASVEQIDAALRAVAVGLSVRVADDARDGFAAFPETDERLLLT